MSVLIKGMEMPMGCYECPFEVWGKCMFIHYNAGGEELSKKCPLIEVPTPHGRLIDADVFDRHMKRTSRYFSMCCDLEEQPTIIEAEKEENDERTD